jgi:hypothetical protein
MILHSKRSLVASGIAIALLAIGARATDGQTLTSTKSATIIPAVPVRDVDTREPFEVQATAVFGQNASLTEPVNIPIPAGKRLVVKFISAEAVVPAGQTVFGSFVRRLVGGAPTRHSLVFTPQGTFNFGVVSVLTASNPMEMSTDAEFPMQFLFQRSDFDGGGSVRFTISGYLVNVP